MKNVFYICALIYESQVIVILVKSTYVAKYNVYQHHVLSVFKTVQCYKSRL